MEVLFWISLSVLFYAYIGYGLLVSILHFFSKKKNDYLQPFQPAVTVIVPAYNEEAFIQTKIQNCLSLRYPSTQLSFVFVTDGSTDGTVDIVRQHPAIQLLHQPERRGKSAAINRAMQTIRTPFVVFTDANTMLHPDCLQQLLKQYRSEKIGGVSGEKRISTIEKTAVGGSERLYWQYESRLKQADADFYTVIGAAGELFSMRTNLFEPLPEDVILDDFVLSARLCAKGYRVAYAHDAFAVENASASPEEEQKRKVRISAGCFQALLLLPELLNPFRNWRLSFQYISRRVMRWTVCPLLILVLFWVNAKLFFENRWPGYDLFFAAQCLFYLLALLGWYFSHKKGLPKVVFIPYYFVFMNLSLYKGFYLFLTNRHSVLWPKAQRRTL